MQGRQKDALVGIPCSLSESSRRDKKIEGRRCDIRKQGSKFIAFLAKRNGIASSHDVGRIPFIDHFQKGLCTMYIKRMQGGGGQNRSKNCLLSLLCVPKGLGGGGKKRPNA